MKDNKKDIISFSKNQPINLISQNNIPQDVLFVLKKLESSEFCSFLVGGCVRDLLLNRKIRDWDILTNANPEEIKMIFSEHKTLMIGKSFQTVTLVLNHKTYQISTFNHKGIVKSGHQKKLFQQLQNDLIFRDFTINAMAWNKETGIIDPASGLEDLSRKMIISRDPAQKFNADPLRMLRAIRLAVELNFKISPEIKKNIKKNAFLIYKASAERIRDELCFILNSPDPGRGIRLLRKLNLQQHIFSLDRIKKIPINQEKGENAPLSGLGDLSKNLAAQLALWGWMSFGSCREALIWYFPVIQYLRFKKKLLKKVEILLSREWQDMYFDSEEKIRFLLAQFGKENTLLFMTLKKTIVSENNIWEQNRIKIEAKLLKEEIKKGHPIKLSDLAVKGDDLIKMGVPKGEKIGEILRIALNEVVKYPEKNQKKDLINYIFYHIHHIRNDKIK